MRFSTIFAAVTIAAATLVMAIPSFASTSAQDSLVARAEFSDSLIAARHITPVVGVRDLQDFLESRGHDLKVARDVEDFLEGRDLGVSLYDRRSALDVFDSGSPVRRSQSPFVRREEDCKICANKITEKWTSCTKGKDHAVCKTCHEKLEADLSATCPFCKGALWNAVQKFTC